MAFEFSAAEAIDAILSVNRENAAYVWMPLPIECARAYQSGPYWGGVNLDVEGSKIHVPINVDQRKSPAPILILINKHDMEQADKPAKHLAYLIIRSGAGRFWHTEWLRDDMSVDVLPFYIGHEYARRTVYSAASRREIMRECRKAATPAPTP